MQELIVNFTIAKLAKEKGFDIITFQMYGSQNIPQLEPYNEIRWNIYHDYYMAPTQSLLQKWLRDIHNIDISVYIRNKDLGTFYGGDIKVNKEDYGQSYGSNFNTYEEALEVGLTKSLMLI